MKYLTTSKLYNDSKARTEDVSTYESKVTKEFGAQAVIEKLPT